MGLTVIDASVVIGVLDPSDTHHSTAVTALRKARAAGDPIALPSSALAEALVGASRLGGSSVQRTEAFIDSIVDVVQDIDRAVARAAAACRAKHRSLRLPDAFVIAAGTVLNASSILTADARWSKIDSRVQLI